MCSHNAACWEKLSPNHRHIIDKSMSLKCEKHFMNKVLNSRLRNLKSTIEFIYAETAAPLMYLLCLKIKSIVIKSKLPTASTVGSLFCGIFIFSVFNKFTARIILAARGTDFCTAVPLFQGTLSIHRSCP